jgi:hypothetical protein
MNNRAIPLFCIIALLTCGFIFTTNGQNLAAYTDYRGYLHAFDNGTFHQLEYLPVQSYKYGGSVIGYVDNKNDFRVYSNGQTITMLNAADFSYYMTDYLLAFKVGSVLYVFDQGEKRTLHFDSCRE